MGNEASIESELGPDGQPILRDIPLDTAPNDNSDPTAAKYEVKDTILLPLDSAQPSSPPSQLPDHQRNDINLSTPQPGVVSTEGAPSTKVENTNNSQPPPEIIQQTTVSQQI